MVQLENSGKKSEVMPLFYKRTIFHALFLLPDELQSCVGVQRREGGVLEPSQLSCVLFYCQLLTVGFIIVCLENLIPCPTGGSTLPQIPPWLLGATSIRERGEGVWGLLAAVASCPFLILEGVCKNSVEWKTFQTSLLKLQ